MNKLNTEIRRMAKNRGVPIGKIAAFLRVGEPKLARWLRDGLPANVKPKIIEFINGEGGAKMDGKEIE